MVNSKKLLSLFLAVVMVLSVFTVMASAYTRVETEGTVDIDVKYTVEKVDTVPETEAGSAEWSADNIYAVTVWMKSEKPVDTFTVPFHYNKAHFAPITLSDGECTYPYGAGLDQDTYYTDMGEGAVYAYSLGDYMNNTGMYKANGTTATTKALAKCIGLGNANSTGVAVISELVSPDHTLYSKWGAGLPADTGVVYANIDVACNAKTAYFNTLEGIATYTDWVNMFTLYFETITEDDVTGDEFGVFTDDCFTVDGNYDANGLGYYESAAKYQATRPTMNIVSNAVVAESGPSFVETTPTIIGNLKFQTRFNETTSYEYVGNKKYVSGYTYDETVAIRNLATIDGATLNQYLDKAEENGYTASGTTTAKEAMAADLIVDMGFIYAKSYDGTVLDRTAAICQHQGLDGGAGTVVSVSYLSTSVDSGNYVISCIIPTINPTTELENCTLSAVGFIVLDTDLDGTADEYYYYDAVVSDGSFYTTYTNNVDSYLANLATRDAAAKEALEAAKAA